MNPSDVSVGIVRVVPDNPLGKALSEVLRPPLSVLEASWYGAAGTLPSTVPDVFFIVCPSNAPEELKALVEQMRNRLPQVPIILAAEHPSVDHMLGLLELNVDDFVTSPFREVDILPRVLKLTGNRHQDDAITRRLKAELGLRGLVGDTRQFLEVIKKLPRMARCDATVLIGGETGTGKELCARAIHYLSPRANQSFVAINCGAMPVELIENELFGHEQGAFTGASTARSGLIHEAQRGTLFLDEVDSLASMAQVKLLRFLQEKEYRPLGSSRPRTADVRVIAATNRDLEAALHEGCLRQDFYYRLNVLSLRLPPLRERQEDIPLLAQHFVRKVAAEFHIPAPILLPEAEQSLLSYTWPGNVRELEHVIERAVVLADDRAIGREEILLPSSSCPAKTETFQEAKKRVVAEFERAYIKAMLLMHRGNISEAARVAGKNRRAFWELMRKHHIDSRPFRTVES
jgi:two-component system response regulator GlrR